MKPNLEASGIDGIDVAPLDMADQQKRSAGVDGSDVADLAVDILDSGDILEGVVNVAGDALGSVADVAGEVLGHVAGAAVDILGGIFD